MKTLLRILKNDFNMQLTTLGIAVVAFWGGIHKKIVELIGINIDSDTANGMYYFGLMLIFFSMLLIGFPDTKKEYYAGIAIWIFAIILLMLGCSYGVAH